MQAPLSRTLDGVQEQRNLAWRELAVRMEGVLAEQNRASCEAMQRLDPTTGASALAIGSGQALFMGSGSPLTQALAMGLSGPPKEGEIEAIEAHLGRAGGPVQFELCPLAAPELFAALAARGYRVQELQLCWHLSLGAAPEEPRVPGLEIRRLLPGEEDAALRASLGGFLECAPGAVPESLVGMLRPALLAPGSVVFGAFEDCTMIGSGVLFVHRGTASIAGAGVLPGHRGRGAQGAMIRARLAAAWRAGGTLVTSSTAPNSASQRNMERHGFRVAYPKVVLVKG